MRVIPFLFAVVILAAGCAPGEGQAAGDGGTPTATSTPTAASTPGAASPARPTPSPSPASSAPAGTFAATTTIAVQVKDGEVRPQPRRVNVARGTRVRLVVESDQPDSVHVHGYDLTKQVGPGNPAEITFVADTPGVFEVETHKSGLVLMQLAVQ